MGKIATNLDSLMRDVSFLFDLVVVCQLVSSFPFAVPLCLALDEIERARILAALPVFEPVVAFLGLNCLKATRRDGLGVYAATLRLGLMTRKY
jgi:hypothetical protein